VFVAGSLAWGVVLDGFRPDRYDLIGASICLIGVADHHVLAAITEPENNKALVRRLVEIVNAGDLERLDEVASGQIAEAERG
jgi:hypothetical protein